MASYDRWLDEASSWPPTSSCWSTENVERFLTAYQSLVRSKRAEQDETAAALTNIADVVGRELSQSLKYVGWSLRPPEDLADAIANARVSIEPCVQLIEKLRTIQTYLDAPPATRFAQQNQWFAALRPHVEEAQKLLELLAPLFQESTRATHVAEPEPLRPPASTYIADVIEEDAVVTPEPAMLPAKDEPSVVEPAVAIGETTTAASPDLQDPDDNAPPEPIFYAAVIASEDTEAVADATDSALPEALSADEWMAEIEEEVTAAVDSRVIVEDERRWLDEFLASLRSLLPDIAVVADDAPSGEPLATTIDNEALRTLFWASIGAGDIAAAYWFACGSERSGDKPPISSETMSAIYALQFRWSDSNQLEEYCSYHFSGDEEPSTPAAGLTILASSIVMAVAAPVTAQMEGGVFSDALRSESSIEELNPIIRAVRDFASEYQPLQCTQTAAIQAAQLRESATAESREAIEDSLEKAKAKTTPLQTANDVFHAWANSGRMFKDALPVLTNDFGAVDRVEERAKWWRDHDSVERALNEDHQKNAGAIQVDDVEYKARNMILRETDKFAAQLKNWCTAVRSTEGGEAAPTHVLTLRVGLKEAAPGLSSMTLPTASDPAMAAAITHLRREIVFLYEAVALPAPLAISRADARCRAVTVSPDVALRRRLDIVGSLAVGDEFDIEERMPSICAALAASLNDSNPAGTAERLVSLGDFRLIDRLLAAMDNDPATAELRENAERGRAEYRTRLQNEIAAALKAVQESAIGTWLSNAEAERFTDELQSIVPGEILLFPPQIARVTEIQRRSSEALLERLSELAARWYQIAAASPSAGVDALDLQSAAALFHGTLQARDVRSAEVFLNELDATAERDGLSEALQKLAGNASMRRRSVFERFLDHESSIVEWLYENSDIWKADTSDPRYLPDRLLRQATIAEGSIRLPKDAESRQASAVAVGHWMRLHASMPPSGEIPTEVLTDLAAIFAFLGYTHSPLRGQSLERGVLFLSASMSAGDQSPIPKWGSQAHNGEHHILVLARKLDVNTLRARMATLPRLKEPLLIIHTGVVDVRTRREIAAFARTQREPILILDDVLLLFLTHCEERRLRAFFECTLPFSASNPYVTELNGSVAPEMFQGHKDDIARLMDRRDTCFICGGRQLGKTALQNYIQKQFDRQTPNRHVWYVNIKDLFDVRGRRNAEAIWGVLYERFCAAGVITRSGTIFRPEAIARALKQAFDTNPALEVTIFLDEADGLLEAMISDRRRVWTDVTNLMAETGRRLKIVFAGNYHISRFAMQRNQSATLMGEPIEIGPMEFSAAADLIEKPLQALGYRIEPPLVLKILSLTYRYASLLQLLMHSLLESKMAAARLAGPRWEITMADVDKAYSEPAVQQAMRHRIEITLDLDPEYCALAYAMLLDQEGTGDFRRSYDTAELKGKALALGPVRFQALSNADVEARLNEMQAVGIVRRTGDRFRLAGPHLISLFGDGDLGKIKARARDLLEKDQPSKFDESAAHAWLDRSAGRYSPLTLVRERQLQYKQTGVRLLFLSAAGGLDQIEEAIRTLQGPGPEGAPIDCVISDDLSPKDTGIWLRAFRTRLNGGHGIALRRVRGNSSAAIHGHVADMHARCVALQNTSPTFQVAFVLDPEAGWAWHQIDENERLPFEQNAIVTARWDALGIRSRLEDLGKIFTQRAAEDVLRATSGWHLLLEFLFKSWPSRAEDPAPVCQSLSHKLEDPVSDVRVAFDAALGVSRGSPAERALLTVGAYGEPLTLDDARALVDDPAAISFLEHYGLLRQESDGRYSVDPLALRLRTQSAAEDPAVA